MCRLNAVRRAILTHGRLTTSAPRTFIRNLRIRRLEVGKTKEDNEGNQNPGAANGQYKAPAKYMGSRAVYWKEVKRDERKTNISMQDPQIVISKRVRILRTKSEVRRPDLNSTCPTLADNPASNLNSSGTGINISKVFTDTRNRLVGEPVGIGPDERAHRATLGEELRRIGTLPPLPPKLNVQIERRNSEGAEKRNDRRWTGYKLPAVDLTDLAPPVRRVKAAESDAQFPFMKTLEGMPEEVTPTLKIGTKYTPFDKDQYDTLPTFHCRSNKCGESEAFLPHVLKLPQLTPDAVRVVFSKDSIVDSSEVGIMIRYLHKELQNLQYLEFGGENAQCELSFATLRRLLKACPNLRALIIHNAPRISEKAIPWILSHCRFMTMLIIEGSCSGPGKILPAVYSELKRRPTTAAHPLRHLGLAFQPVCDLKSIVEAMGLTSMRPKLEVQIGGLEVNYTGERGKDLLGRHKIIIARGMVRGGTMPESLSKSLEIIGPRWRTTLSD